MEKAYGVGTVLLRDVAQRTQMLDIACSRCDRRGVVSMAKMMKEHGGGMPMPALLKVLAGDCPKWATHSVYDQCGAHYPRLGEIMG